MARTYRFLAGEQLAEAAGRVARGRIDHALDQLRESTDGDRETAIHEVRKDLKKLRALLRLMRGDLGGKVYRRENRAFREAGRKLSGARDAEVMLRTLESLESSSETGLAPRDHTGLKRELERRRSLALRDMQAGNRVEEVRSALRESRSRIKTWPLQDEGFGAIEPGLRRSYKRGRRALRSVEQDPTSEALHEWRKRIKDLWYHLRLIAEAGPPLTPMTEQADVLAERLGEDHDLAVLSATAAEWSARSDGDLEPLQRAITSRRRELQAESLPLGRELYADQPGRFIKRVRGLWEAAPALAS